MEDGRLEHRRILEMTKEAEATDWLGAGLFPIGVSQKGGEHDPQLSWAQSIGQSQWGWVRSCCCPCSPAG